MYAWELSSKALFSLKLEFFSHNKTTHKQRYGQKNQARPKSSLHRQANGLPHAASQGLWPAGPPTLLVFKRSPTSPPTCCGKWNHQHSQSTSANSLGILEVFPLRLGSSCLQFFPFIPPFGFLYCHVHGNTPPHTHTALAHLLFLKPTE